MVEKAVIFGLALFAVIWLLRLFPQSTLSRFAFSWFGPLPSDGESWAKYQLRWAIYSFDWFAQISVLLAALYGAPFVWPSVMDYQIYSVFATFALPIGAATALCAVLIFLAKAAKARLFGPNPRLQRHQRTD